jgi:hypothetical protein
MAYAKTSNGESMQEIQSLTLRIQRLGQDVDWWNTAMIVALILAALAAVAVVITTRMALVKAKELTDAQGGLDKAKDRELQQALKAKDEEIEKERSARVQIEQALAWRSLSAEDESLISSQLLHFRGERIAVWYDAGDAEGAAFAWELAGVLHRAKWQVFAPASFQDIAESGIPYNSAIASLRTGIEVIDTDVRSHKAAEVLFRTLNACGFSFSSACAFFIGRRIFDIRGRLDCQAP